MNFDQLKLSVIAGGNFRTSTGERINIDIVGNNMPLRRDTNQKLPWKFIYEQYVTGAWDLIDSNGDHHTNRRHGGYRQAGPGKSLGRNPVHPSEKKKPVSIGMNDTQIAYLDYLVYLTKSKSRSEYINNLIAKEYDLQEEKELIEKYGLD